MEKLKSALILIGFQNDYFGEDGSLREVVQESLEATGVLKNTLNMIEELTNMLIISTPIVFTSDYCELIEPVGILKIIKDVGAFKMGETGSEIIPEIKKLGDVVMHIPGKQGLNAFINTNLEKILEANKITEVLLAGVVCSICIDSTGRSAFEQGYKVTMLSDCISGRTVFEQKFYCDNIFPLYSKVIDSKEFIREFKSRIFDV